MEGKHIMIFGGSGSLGTALIERYSRNQITNYSRDECKHWEMSLKYNNVTNIIGDIRDSTSVERSILRTRPNIIIIAAALKHIDRCEYAIDECIKTNVVGTQNVLDAIEKNVGILEGILESVLFVSTDKACSPVNSYGMAKALSENLMIERSYYLKQFKFVSVRYGNVLNSRGSIIPILHQIGQNNGEYRLTDPAMTRFIMTLEDSCKLIEYAIINGQSGEIIIPKLRSMRIEDLFSIFCELYGKRYTITKLRPGEKINESLINETQARRSTYVAPYYHISPNYLSSSQGEEFNYHSGQDTISITELYNYLVEYSLIEPKVNFSLEGILSDSPYSHIVLEDVLPENLAKSIQAEILALPVDAFDRYANPF